MDKAAHTALPWFMGRKGAVCADAPVAGMAGSDNVGHYGGHLICESITEVNAEFMVKAVNAHELLVAALKDCMRHPRLAQRRNIVAKALSRAGVQ